MPNPSSGTLANRAGRRLEKFVSEILNERGYTEVESKKFDLMCKEGRPVYARQHKFGKNIYDKLHRVDLIIFHPNLFPDSLVIQCKWQSSRGSVEEKYPFEVLNIKKSGCDTIFVLDGGGYTPGAKEWLLNQVGKDHLLYVFDQGEFSRFASKGNLG